MTMAVNRTLLHKAVLTGVHASGVSHALAPILSGHGAILMLHRVLPKPPKPDLTSFLSITPEFLDSVLTDLKRRSISIISMDEVADRLSSGRFCSRFVAITLDDGFSDNVEHGLPVFEAHDAPFTVYVSSGFASRTAHLWWDDLAEAIERRRHLTVMMDDGPFQMECATPGQKCATFQALHRYLTTRKSERDARQFVDELVTGYGVDPAARVARDTLDWDGVRALSRSPLATIGAHTVNHYHLARLDDDEARFEMEQSRRAIELETGQPAHHIAYPYGSKLAAGRREARLARETSFKTGVTTRHGLIRTRHCGHPHALPRISLNGNFQELRYVNTLLRGTAVPLANWGRRFVTM